MVSKISLSVIGETCGQINVGGRFCDGIYRDYLVDFAELSAKITFSDFFVSPRKNSGFIVTIADDSKSGFSRIMDLQ